MIEEGWKGSLQLFSSHFGTSSCFSATEIRNDTVHDVWPREYNKTEKDRIEEDFGTVRLLSKAANQILAKNASLTTRFEWDDL